MAIATIDDLIGKEQRLALAAPERYGVYYFHARDTALLLSKCLVSVDISQVYFARFFSYTKKHHLLAILSSVRLHKVQAFMNLRHVLEGGTWAAYAIAHPKQDAFVETGPDGMIRMSNKLTNRRNVWLDKNFRDASTYIKTQKDRINETIAHAGLVYTQTVFDINEASRTYELPFFDNEDGFHIRTDLWLIAAIGISLMDLFYGVKHQCGGIMEFAADFEDHVRALQQQNAALQHVLQSDERHTEIEARERALKEQACQKA